MGNINAWLCACEKSKDLGGKKCANCLEGIYHNQSNHKCEWAIYGATCDKKW